ncbi:MAG: ATP-dependent zinc metalloprotease FtsH [Chloroflexi bacterium]|nr:ATP-dependent zinc metalloprotease FtsH [Chloroflexota bacterium]
MYLWIFLAAAVVLSLLPFLFSGSPAETVPISSVVGQIKAGTVRAMEVSADGQSVTVLYKTGGQAVARKERELSIVALLSNEGIAPEDWPVIRVEGESSVGGGMLSWLLPLLLIGGFVVVLLLMSGGQRSSNDNATNSTSLLNFGKSRARRFVVDRPQVTFSQVAGVEEAKQELQEVVEFLKFPDKFAALGARIPKGALLVGPPGTGKTLLGRAVAGEAAVPFFSISGSEFVEMFVGVGASRVRDLFEQAKKAAPCIVFIDEIDAVGRQRGVGLGGGNDEREQTLNQILVEMDGFDTKTNIIVMAATNRPDVLDPALLRPGRFDRQVVLDRPDVRGRRAILDVHARGKRLDEQVDLDRIARLTPGFSGADLENLLNEAAILAARRNLEAVGTAELEEAIERVVAGPERRSRVISPREKVITAYHEMGHALVATSLPNADPVHKVSILARGMAGGYTRLLPEEDRHLWTRSQFEAALAFMLGGLAAEELVFGERSSGASDDIEKSSSLARRMVCEFGMSEAIGPLALGVREGSPFLGRDLVMQRNFSEDMARQVDDEVRQLVMAAHSRARAILLDQRDRLSSGAELLVRVEVLEGDELAAVLTGRIPGREVVGERAEVVPALPVSDLSEVPQADAAA